jgi:hypothetical protein
VLDDTVDGDWCTPYLPISPHISLYLPIAP